MDEPLQYLARVMTASQHLAEGVTVPIWSTEATKKIAQLIGAEKIARKAVLQSLITMLATVSRRTNVSGDFVSWKSTFQTNVAQCIITTVASVKPELFGNKLTEVLNTGHINQVNIMYINVQSSYKLDPHPKVFLS